MPLLRRRRVERGTRGSDPALRVKQPACATPDDGTKQPARAPSRNSNSVPTTMSRTVYVGNLPIDVREREVDDLFYKCGRIVDIDLKTPGRPPAYAFIEFERPDDADEAIKRRDGYEFAGARIRVELSRRGGGGRGGRDGGRGGPPPRRGRAQREPKNFDLCIDVENLPDKCSWQDLKDFMRKAGEVAFADVYESRSGRLKGIVEFVSRDDMDYALRKLDDTEMKNPFDRAYIRCYPYEDDKPSSRPRSRSRSRSPAPRGRSRSRSRSRSPPREPRGDALMDAAPAPPAEAPMDPPPADIPPPAEAAPPPADVAPPAEA